MDYLFVHLFILYMQDNSKAVEST